MSESDNQVRSKLRGEWTDDGHRVVPHLDYDSVRLRVECPGEGCKAHAMACECEGSGCARCDHTGREPDVPEGFCWLRDMAPEYDFVEVFFVGGRVDLGADNRIVWKVDYDEWEWALRSQVQTPIDATYNLVSSDG
jgi:hypothetical protein